MVTCCVHGFAAYDMIYSEIIYTIDRIGRHINKS